MNRTASVQKRPFSAISVCCSLLLCSFLFRLAHMSDSGSAQPVVYFVVIFYVVLLYQNDFWL